MTGFALQLRQYADRVVGDADRVVRTVALEIGSRLIIRSPVDTGRFRANWRFAMDAPDLTSVETTGTTANPTPAPGPPAFNGRALGRIVYWTNNMPYGPALERGHSKQRPIGLVGVTAMEFIGIVDGAAAGIGSIAVTGA